MAAHRPHHRRRSCRPFRRRAAGAGAGERVRRARGDRAGRRALPLLSRPHHRHDDRQRQPSAAVGQPRGAALSRRDRRAAPAGRPRRRPSSRSSICERASAGRCALNDGRCRGGSSTARAACRARAPLDYLSLLRLLRRGARRDGRRRASTATGTLYDRLIGPLLLAALNIEPPEGSAALASAVMRETLLAGGQACRPLIARDGLGHRVRRAGARTSRSSATSRCALEHAAARAARSTATRVSALDFGDDERRRSAPDDAVILAVPPHGRGGAGARACRRRPSFRAIVNAHFRIEPPPGVPPMHRRGQRHGGVAVRLPGPAVGHHQRRRPAARHAARRARRARSGARSRRSTGIAADLPPWQIVRERRATFAATPAAERQAARRAQRSGANLFLAGDWTATGLPATIEGAIRSGQRAPPTCIADKACERQRRRIVDAADRPKRPQRIGSRIAPRREALLDAPAAGRPLGVRARGRRHHPGRIRAAAPLSAASRSTPSWSARSRVYLRRIQGAHGGWPLFHDGAFDMSASVKAYFALKMIGDDIDAPHMRRAREAILRARRRRARQRLHPRCCWRCSARCRGARCR